ncbi:unnamed protein product [Ixodes hexagonus]
MGGNTRSPSSLTIHPTQTHTGRQSYAQPARLHASCRMRAEDTHPSRHPTFHQSRTYPKKHAPHLQQGTPRSPDTSPQNPIRTLPGLFFYSLHGCFPVPPTTSPCRERHRRPLQRTDGSYNPHYVYRDSRRARHSFGGHHWRRVHHCTDRLSSHLPQLPTRPHITSGPQSSTKRAPAPGTPYRLDPRTRVLRGKRGGTRRCPRSYTPGRFSRGRRHANSMHPQTHSSSKIHGHPRPLPPRTTPVPAPAPPPPPLSRAEATAFRRLQTNSYSHGTLLHAMCPTLYPATCNFCSQPGTLYHMVWECQQTPSLAPNPHPTYDQWVGQLTSSDLSAQRSLVERARAASADQGFPD